MTTHECLELLLRPMSDAFSVEFARRLVELRASPELQQRVDELAEKANEGTLSEAESADYKALIETSTMIAVLQNQARRFLAHDAA